MHLPDSKADYWKFQASRIYLPYAGVGVSCVILGISMITFSYFVALPLQAKTKDNTSEETGANATDACKIRFDAVEIVLVLLLSAFIFFDVCVENCYTGGSCSISDGGMLRASRYSFQPEGLVGQIRLKSPANNFRHDSTIRGSIQSPHGQSRWRVYGWRVPLNFLRRSNPHRHWIQALIEDGHFGESRLEEFSPENKRPITSNIPNHDALIALAIVH